MVERGEHTTAGDVEAGGSILGNSGLGGVLVVDVCLGRSLEEDKRGEEVRGRGGKRWGGERRKGTLMFLMMTALPQVYKKLLPFGSPPSTTGLPRVVKGEGE